MKNWRNVFGWMKTIQKGDIVEILKDISSDFTYNFLRP
jgi:hypothetical protein